MSDTASLSKAQRDAVALMAYALELSHQTSLEQVLPESHALDTTLRTLETLVGKHLYANDERIPSGDYLTGEQRATLGVLTMAVDAWQQNGLMDMAIGGDREVEAATHTTTDVLTTAADQHALPL